MKRFVWKGTIVLFGALVLAGCSSTSPSPQPPAKGPVGMVPVTESKMVAVPADQGVKAIGGRLVWHAIRRVEGTMVLSDYLAKGHPYVNQFQFKQQLTSERTGWRMFAQAIINQRILRLEAPVGGQSGRQSSYTPDPQLQAQLNKALSRVLQVTPGVWNVVMSNDRGWVVVREATQIEGLPVEVVRVEKGPFVGTYYFDAKTKLLRYVTGKNDVPGHGGWVAIYSYQDLGKGIKFPKTIEIRKMGNHALLGEEKILHVEFSDVTLHRTIN